MIKQFYEIDELRFLIFRFVSVAACLPARIFNPFATIVKHLFHLLINFSLNNVKNVTHVRSKHYCRETVWSLSLIVKPFLVIVEPWHCCHRFPLISWYHIFVTAFWLQLHSTRVEILNMHVCIRYIFLQCAV